LLAAVGVGSPAGAAPASGRATVRGYLYWTNQYVHGTRKAPAVTGTIGRARLNGTDVNQKFITGASGPIGLAVDPGR
jgi:virginiamycin B lyase